MAVPKRQIVKIAICVPSGGRPDGGFAFDYGNLMAWTTGELVARGVDLTVNWQMSSYIHANRTDLVSLALADKDVTHLFWLDDDMRFPRDSIARLLQHRQPIVGVNYSHRKPPPQPVACKRVRPKERFHCAVCDKDKAPTERGGMKFLKDRLDRVTCPTCGLERWCMQYRLVTDENSTGLEVVEGIGFGMVLIAREVFENTKFPWFMHGYDYDHEQAIGEDTWFCDLAQEAGYPVFVDHDLSKEMRHSGHLEYSLEHANNWRAIHLEQRHVAAGEALLAKARDLASKPQLVVSA